MKILNYVLHKLQSVYYTVYVVYNLFSSQPTICCVFHPIYCLHSEYFTGRVNIILAWLQQDVPGASPHWGYLGLMLTLSEKICWPQCPHY